jgi:Fe-S cluster assembly iron-binding protein IscA
VKKGGCNGYVYTMTFADKVLPTDEVVKDEGMLFVSEKTIKWVIQA